MMLSGLINELISKLTLKDIYIYHFLEVRLCTCLEESLLIQILIGLEGYVTKMPELIKSPLNFFAQM